MSTMFTTMSEAIESYDEMIDETHPAVELLGGTYDPVTLIRRIDPIAYRVGFYDYMDSLGVDTDELEDDADL